MPRYEQPCKLMHMAADKGLKGKEQVQWNDQHDPKDVPVPLEAEDELEPTGDEESDDEGNLNVAIRDKGKNRKRTWNPNTYRCCIRWFFQNASKHRSNRWNTVEIDSGSR
jgi:hypothetical protein